MERKRERERCSGRLLSSWIEFTDISEHARYESCFVRKHDGSDNNSIVVVVDDDDGNEQDNKEKDENNEEENKDEEENDDDDEMRPCARVPFARKRDARFASGFGTVRVSWHSATPPGAEESLPDIYDTL